METSPRSSSLPQFSLRTLFVAVSGVAFFMGYWMSLPSVVPRWEDLLTRLDVSRTHVAAEGWLYGKGVAFHGWNDAQPPSYVAFIALLSFYFAKLYISRRIKSIDLRIFAFVMLLCPTLTCLYLYWTDWGNGLIFYLGNWLIVPVGVLAVPAATFFYDLLRNKMPTIRRHVIRSAIEMLVVTPVWCYIWIWTALMLGLYWI